MNSEEELQELEKKLYAAADKMRGAVPVSSYKFIILGLIFLVLGILISNIIKK